MEHYNNFIPENISIDFYFPFKNGCSFLQSSLSNKTVYHMRTHQENKDFFRKFRMLIYGSGLLLSENCQPYQHNDIFYQEHMSDTCYYDHYLYQNILKRSKS